MREGANGKQTDNECGRERLRERTREREEEGERAITSERYNM